MNINNDYEHLNIFNAFYLLELDNDSTFKNDSLVMASGFNIVGTEEFQKKEKCSC